MPGLTLLAAPSSIWVASPGWKSELPSPTVGLLGPNCTSVKGGGEGSLGELEGDTPERTGDLAAISEPALTSILQPRRTVYSLSGLEQSPPEASSSGSADVLVVETMSLCHHAHSGVEYDRRDSGSIVMRASCGLRKWRRQGGWMRRKVSEQSSVYARITARAL